MNDNITWIIGTLIAVIGLLLGAMGYFYNRNRNIRLDAEAKLLEQKQDAEKRLEEAKIEARENGSIIQKIESMTATIISLTQSVNAKFAVVEDRSEQRNKICSAHGERLVIVEQSTKSAHNRLDEHNGLFTEIRQMLTDIQRNQNGGKN